MWFNKTKKDKNNVYVNATSIDDLKKSIDKLQERSKELNNDLLKLKRIIKNSKDKPTFKLEPCYFKNIICDYKLYLYIEKEEYIINLKELSYEKVDIDSAKLIVEDNIAYFNISSYLTIEKEKYWTRHKFIIEFENDKYVYSKEDDKREIII